MSSPVMVFSHPNHEIAVLGTIFRMHPHIIYLTDGGGEERVAQTRQALENYQPASVHYLNHSEQSLYDALLDRDAEFYRALAEQVGDVIAELDAETVYCDAVEFYNPVHDIALPVVRAALRGNDVPIIEVPLIYQTTAPEPKFELQHVPHSLSNRGIFVDLSPAELERKLTTINSGVYAMLFAQLGGAIRGAAGSRAEREAFLKARNKRPSPAPEQLLRYETRGNALRDAGEIRDVITFDRHYTPVFEALCGSA